MKDDVLLQGIFDLEAKGKLCLVFVDFYKPAVDHIEDYIKIGDIRGALEIAIQTMGEDKGKNPHPIDRFTRLRS
jgi:hypothetical protein